MNSINITLQTRFVIHYHLRIHFQKSICILNHMGVIRFTKVYAHESGVLSLDSKQHQRILTVMGNMINQTKLKCPK